jgi:vancomycin aglycone glucosyltransferase
MQVLISSIGSRGEVQPIVALALELLALGHDATICVPPNFKDWVESFELSCTPIGPDVQKLASRLATTKHRKPKLGAWRKIVDDTVRDQFITIGAAAESCDLIVACGGLQSAARSIAEAQKKPYVYAAYCAGTLPSAAHPPPMIRSQGLPSFANRFLWKASESGWNKLFRRAVNEQRAALGMNAVDSVPRHIFTDRPWLAADPVLSPAAAARGFTITQTGAWLLPDPAPLPAELESFLSAGELPIYFGFGSMQAKPETSRTLVEAARKVGRRAIISRGWGNLDVADGAADCIAISDLGHQQLFRRVAAVVHHGGAGTTTTAARAGVPQVVVPHIYDQHYWAARVQHLGIGVSGPTSKRLDASALAAALRKCLQPGVAAAARAVSGRIEANGSRLAAQRLVDAYG